MKVLMLFSHRWRGGRAGGAETHTIDLIKGLAAKGHSIFFVTDKTDEESVRVIGEHIGAHFVLPFQTISPFDKFKTFSRITEIAVQHQIEIVHTHHRTAGYFAELLCQKRRIPYVITVHDPWHATPLKRIHAKLFRNIIAVSIFLKQILIRRFGIPSERIRVIHNGVDPGRFEGIAQEDAVRFRAGFGVGPDEIVLSQISRISKVKGQADLLNALKLLPAEISYRCFICGEGSERPRLEKLAKSLALNDKVIFCGYQSNIPVVLAASNVMLLPSRREGLPLSVVEAMLSKVPVIAAITAGVPEIITDGENGLLFQAGDIPAFARHIDRMIQDQCLRQRLALAGYRTAVERFLVSRMVAETEEYYRSIVSESGVLPAVPSPGFKLEAP